MEVYSCDVPTAFLNASIKEEVYIQPPGYVAKGPVDQKVWKLKKALYGIKQAPYAWNEEINGSIMALGYNRCTTDRCIYVKNSSTGSPMFIPLYVDDMFPMCMTADDTELRADMAILCAKYSIPEMQPIVKVLGMNLKRDRETKTISLTQPQYVKTLLENYDMIGCRISPTPERMLGTPGSKTDEVSKRRLKDERNEGKWCVNGEYTFYGSLVGALMWLANATRPDIAHAVGMLSRKIRSPDGDDWVAAKRVLRYLAGTIDDGITYGGEGHQEAELGPAFSDSDWAGDQVQRKSTSGYVVKMNGGPVIWGSRKQKTFATSSAEAEYYALGEVFKEVLFLRNFLSEIGLDQDGIPTEVRCDNKPAIDATYNGMSRMKHIALRHNFLKDHVDNGNIKLDWVSTVHQQADGLTKALGTIQFEHVRTMLMG